MFILLFSANKMGVEAAEALSMEKLSASQEGIESASLDGKMGWWPLEISHLMKTLPSNKTPKALHMGMVYLLECFIRPAASHRKFLSVHPLLLPLNQH